MCLMMESILNTLNSVKSALPDDLTLSIKSVHTDESHCGSAVEQQLSRWSIYLLELYDMHICAMILILFIGSTGFREISL